VTSDISKNCSTLKEIFANDATVGAIVGARVGMETGRNVGEVVGIFEVVGDKVVDGADGVCKIVGAKDGEIVGFTVGD